MKTTIVPMHEIWTNLLEKREKIHAGIKLSLLFSPLFFYLYFDRPELPILLTIGLFSFWISSLFLDMRITVSLKNMIRNHEANDIFRNLYRRFGTKAIAIQIGIESSFVILFPSIMTLRQPGESFEVDMTGAAILGGIIGVLHVFAWHSNKKEILKINDKKPSSL